MTGSVEQPTHVIVVAPTPPVETYTVNVCFLK